MADDPNRIKSVENAFEILEAIDELQSARASELSDHLELPTSTTHIYLKTMQELGFLDVVDNEYYFNLRFLEFGGEARHRLQLYRAGKSQVDRLAEETGHFVSLGVENQGRRCLVYKMGGENTVQHVRDREAKTGIHVPMHWTAMGKTILATKSNEEVESIVSEHGLEPSTEYTITDPGALTRELERIREQGYAIEDEEYLRWTRSVAVPIENEKNQFLGSISISSAKHRLSDDPIENELVDVLRTAANTINLQLEPSDSID